MGTAIDPQRIEAALSEHPRLDEVRVIADSDAEGRDDGRAQLVAYVVPRGGAVEPSPGGELKFSLFYFADAARGPGDDNYRLYLEGAKFADAHGFEAVWTPERHFHANGGLYPNPSVLSAALAIATRRVKLRAGSVALPLHYPLRVAEEWSVVDNLSKGRVGLSFTSGWVPNDFAIAPSPEESFKAKREVMLRNLEEVRRLWEGGTTKARDGAGNEVELEIFPKPVQPTLPVWMTCSGDPAMFEKAGELGFNVLTALLTQSLEETAGKIALYRKSRAAHGLDPAGGRVTLMLHTFVGEDEEMVKRLAREPLTDYFKSHIDLIKTMIKSLNIQLEDVDPDDPVWLDYLASFAFERYYQAGSLIGTPSKCMAMVERLKRMGVDEVACFIDFGVEADLVLRSLKHLNELREMSDAASALSAASLRKFLNERLAEDVGPITFEIRDCLPATDAGRPPDAEQTGRPHDAATLTHATRVASRADALRSVDERVRVQRAARERQNQLKGMGR
ncbi:MAG TPA: MupA/Atu3671 family FMN-dependent luciferase-like monooxygenase [Pyrinomonadaceae bacterium]|nr:MupA/Atu3671 family FMN-dependent luciferase-like monooxygenase [Pyrinomonadaceae bacterium]